MEERWLDTTCKLLKTSATGEEVQRVFDGKLGSQCRLLNAGTG